MFNTSFKTQDKDIKHKPRSDEKLGREGESGTDLVLETVSDNAAHIAIIKHLKTRGASFGFEPNEVIRNAAPDIDAAGIDAACGSWSGLDKLRSTPLRHCKHSVAERVSVRPRHRANAAQTASFLRASVRAGPIADPVAGPVAGPVAATPELRASAGASSTLSSGR